MTEPSSLTNKALARLKSLAKGNGVNPDSIQIIESKENTYTVMGKLSLTPQMEVQSTQLIGRVKGKGIHVHTSFDDLRAEIQAIDRRFKEDGSWFDQAIQELERTKGHGWGQEAALLSWSNKKMMLAATEKCPMCRGTAQHPCTSCKGLGTMPCQNCAATGQEPCWQCMGTGFDPQNHNTPCPLCHGTRVMLCRFCQGTTKLPCVSCQGRGHTPCTACKATGFISQEITINQGARIDFSLSSSSGLPSGLLRTMSRIGDEKLPMGHADISMKPEIPEEKKFLGNGIITLTATIPYADIKVRIGKKAGLVNCFGKMAKLSGVPPFLDEAITHERKMLAEAVQGHDTLDNAMKVRIVSEALDSALSGKTKTNDLRRLYPVGLSGEVAQEIMTNVSLLLKRSTVRTRLYAASLCLLGFTTLFAALFLTPVFGTLTSTLPPAVALGTEAILPVLAMIATWFALLSTTRWILMRKFPNAKIAPTQDIGKTGYGTMGLILVAYVVILYIAGLVG